MRGDARRGKQSRGRRRSSRFSVRLCYQPSKLVKLLWLQSAFHLGFIRWARDLMDRLMRSMALALLVVVPSCACTSKNSGQRNVMAEGIASSHPRRVPKQAGDDA